jgi:hypothetical protein
MNRMVTYLQCPWQPYSFHASGSQSVKMSKNTLWMSSIHRKSQPGSREGPANPTLPTFQVWTIPCWLNFRCFQRDCKLYFHSFSLLLLPDGWQMRDWDSNPHLSIYLFEARSHSCKLPDQSRQFSASHVLIPDWIACVARRFRHWHKLGSCMEFSARFAPISSVFMSQ